MIPTGTPARAAHKGADSALENWTGQPAELIPEKFILGLSNPVGSATGAAPRSRARVNPKRFDRRLAMVIPPGIRGGSGGLETTAPTRFIGA